MKIWCPYKINKANNKEAEDTEKQMNKGYHLIQNEIIIREKQSYCLINYTEMGLLFYDKNEKYDELITFFNLFNPKL